MPPESTPASRPKKIVKMIIMNSGWRMAHAAPSARLFVAHLHVAPGQEEKQLAIRPEILETDRVSSFRLVE